MKLISYLFEFLRHNVCILYKSRCIYLHQCHFLRNPKLLFRNFWSQWKFCECTVNRIHNANLLTQKIECCIFYVEVPDSLPRSFMVKLSYLSIVNRILVTCVKRTCALENNTKDWTTLHVFTTFQWSVKDVMRLALLCFVQIYFSSGIFRGRWKELFNIFMIFQS